MLLAVCLLIGATIERGKLVGLRGDALASIFYVANWRFIFEHESYFAQFGRPALLRHLWSLAVEEQFYSCGRRCSCSRCGCAAGERFARPWRSGRSARRR